MPVARVGNLNRTLEELKAAVLWVTGAAMSGESAYGCDLTGPIALVIGSEGDGMGRLVRESCDFILSLPMKGRLNSLNASAAAAVTMYEILRQRSR
jgi:23S rRNA (guanosine2251-2'-O)-methyltransferase